MDGRFSLALPSNGVETADEMTQPNGVGNGNGIDHGDVQLTVPSGFPVC